MVSEMTFFISSISAEVCRGKKNKTNQRFCYHDGSVRNWFNKWLEWFRRGGEMLPWFFLKDDIWPSVSTRSHQVSSEEETFPDLRRRYVQRWYRWTISGYDLERLVIFNFLHQKEKRSSQTTTSNVGGASWRSPSSRKTPKHFSALTSPDKT